MSSDHEVRAPAPVHATGAVEFVALDEVAADETFRLRPDGDVALLATSLGRLGQLAPVELRPWPGAGSEGPRWQLVSGFRRLAAVRLLARERVLARLHRDLSDEDAWGLALGEALLHEPLTGDHLAGVRERLVRTGVAPWAEELVDEALVRAPVAAELRERFHEWLAGGTSMDATSTGAQAPTEASTPISTSTEAPPADAIEITAEDLADDLVSRMAGLNQDLATALEAWKDLPLAGRQLLAEQVRWLAEALPYMEADE